MTQNWHPFLGYLFGPCHELPVDTRLRLAKMLAVPGRMVAALPEDLASLPLPRTSQERAAVGRAIVAGLGSEVVSALGPSRLREVVPAIEGRPGGTAATAAARRLHALLERNGATNWNVLSDLTLDTIVGWHGVGASTASLVIGLVLEAGVSFLDDDEAHRNHAIGSQPGAPSGIGGAARDLAVLLAYDRDAGSGSLRQAIEGLTQRQHPAPVRAAATRLVTVRAPNPCLAILERALAAIGDDRDRGLFEHRSLRLEGRPTIPALAAALGIGAERARQLRARAETRIRHALDASPAAVHELAASIAAELGTVAPTGATDASLAAIGLPPLADSRSLLALWLAGPYHPVTGHPGWIATDPVEITIECRRLLAEDDGVRLIELVTKELEMLGMTPAHVTPWLSGQPVRQREGLVVLIDGPPEKVAERVLSATGTAMTVEELWAWSRPASVAGATSGAGTARLRAVLEADRRFTRVTTERFELTEWGATPYREPDSEPDPRGGPWHGYPVDQDGQCWLHVEIDEEALAGSAAPVPAPLVEALGVRPGARRSFATRYGPVTLNADTARPTRGSVRPVALAAGAAVGDTLAIGFRPGDNRAEVRLLPSGTAAG